MKHFLAVTVSVLCVCVFPACNKTGSSSSSPDATYSKDASYALGLNIGTGLKADNIIPDMEAFAQGILDILNDAQPRFSLEEAYQIFNDEYNMLAEERELVNKQAEIEFLAENSKKPGINITGSGLQYEVITEGNGPKPTAADRVRVHYEGALTDGSVFDSSYSRGEPIEFSLGGVIPGWTEGLQLMSEGSKYRLFIPSDLGYGPQGAGGQIPPYSTLVFEVELLGIIQ